MHQAELKRLEFHAIWNIGIFYRRLLDKVDLLYSAPKYLFKLMVRIQKTYRGSVVYLVCLALWRLLIQMQYLFLEEKNRKGYVLLMLSPLFPSLILSISQIISRASTSSLQLSFLLFLPLNLFPPSMFLYNSSNFSSLSFSNFP